MSNRLFFWQKYVCARCGRVRHVSEMHLSAAAQWTCNKHEGKTYGIETTAAALDAQRLGPEEKARLGRQRRLA